MLVSRRLLSGETHSSPVAFRLVPVYYQDVVVYTCNVSRFIYGQSHGWAATSFASLKVRGGQHRAHSALAAWGES